MNISNLTARFGKVIEEIFVRLGLTALFLFVVALIGLAAILIYGALHRVYTVELPRWSTAECERRWQQSGLDVQWKVGIGCMVYVNGRWVPEANVQLQPK
jgi:hypothetical protein